MDNRDELHSARALQASRIDEMIAQFEAYKRRRRLDQQEFELQLNSLNFNTDFEELSTRMENLRVGLEKLARQKQLQQRELSAIEPAPLVKAVRSHQPPHDTDKEVELVVASGMSQCVYPDCPRRIDNQLLLLHYLYDHEQEESQFLSLLEGEPVVLSFPPKSCSFRVNKVLGILAYGGQMEHQFGITQRQCTFCNTFLPDHLSHLTTHVPVVVLICWTAAHDLRSKNLERGVRWHSDSEEDTVFVIWLVTPCDRIRLNATLSVCGRDDALRMITGVGVRHVNHSQDTARFTAVDNNFWRLKYNEMKRLSNRFRDELNLEIRLTEPQDSTNST